MILTIAKLAERAGYELGTRLRGRQPGERFHQALRDYIGSVPKNNLIHFKLEDNIMMDVSFIDEVFGGIAEARGRGELSGAAMLLIEVDPLDVDDISRILEGRPGYSTGLRNCVLPLAVQSSIRLIGKTEDYVAETFSYLAARSQVTTSDLATDLDLAQNTASTRLKTLYDLGLALRKQQETGRGYTYHMLTAP